jgi:hypothetical protein
LLSCRGHPNVQAAHETTLELEESPNLTIRGDCIICVECKNTDSARQLVAERGLSKLFLIAVNPFIKPYVAGLSIDGFSPGKKPRRLIVRKSYYTKDALMICSSKSAAELPAEFRKLLQSSYTKCFALLVLSRPIDHINSIYELAGCVVEDTSHPNTARHDS